MFSQLNFSEFLPSVICQIILWETEDYSKSSQTSKMELFAKVVNGF